MIKIKLYDQVNDINTPIDKYILDSKVEYVINIDDELQRQMAILKSFQLIGPPPAINNYHAWLFENGFNVESPNPTNEFVKNYYGIKPLWKTEYSQGIVVMDESDSDYFIVMECSSKNIGYRHTKIVLTLGGCI